MSDQDRVNKAMDKIIGAIAQPIAEAYTQGTAQAVAEWKQRAETAETELAEARTLAERFANAVEVLAFDMPPPNTYTPLFVELCAGFRLQALASPAPAVPEILEAISRWRERYDLALAAAKPEEQSDG